MAIVLGTLTQLSLFAQTTPDLSRAGNEQVAEIMRSFGGRGVMADDSPPTPASEAVRQFRMRDGFRIELVEAEPTVAQPLFLSWDSRGRMWVVHYRQYQYPAGLKVIRYDQHLRAVFDKVPDPPPLGVKGDDKISVHEDRDGDGIFESHQDVITGLNIATAVQVGNGSIWVLNPPYLLRYGDQNGDDVPDGDPEVHLSGFGLQDTHSVANSLLWGPDGWLYGANGSTTVGDVSSAVTKGVRFQGQCIWRYHPTSKEFEIYAEGGGNTFSLDIDSRGRVFSGTNGGNTRGWYYPQGSYSEKNWGKHGPLTNPFAFGFFPPMKFEGDGRRFPQAFCIYEGGLYPREFSGSIIAPNALHNLVWQSQRLSDGSTYRTVDNENLVESPDRWFRPVYCGVGPDGAAYIADWYDTRLSHVSPTDDWHKESGRIYRIVPDGSSPRYTLGDLSQLNSEALIDLFAHPNKWVRQRAALELGWRHDSAVVAKLAEEVDRGSLEALWAIRAMEQLSSARVDRWLGHADADIRRWVVRLLGDRHEGHPGMAALAVRESNAQVRSQLASTAKRLAAADAFPIIESLLRHDEDVSDPHLPLLVWWVLEAHCDQWERVVGLISNAELWHTPMFQQHVSSRLMQRYASTGTSEDLEHCAWLLQSAPDEEARRDLMIGLSRAFQGRSLPPLPPALATALETHQSGLGDSALVLGLRQANADAIERSLRILTDRAGELGIQVEIARVLGEVKIAQALSTLTNLATGRATNEPSLQRVAMQSLSQYDDASIPSTLVAAFGSSISGEHSLRSTACRTLASRPAWAKILLDEVNAWRVRPDEIPPDVVQQLRTYDRPEIVASVEQAFGRTIDSMPEKLAEANRLRELLLAGRGDPDRGKLAFTKKCGNCHQLFGEGQKVGPQLDGYERGNLSFWLNAIVDPNLEIREGFQSYLILMLDGRSLNGMIAAQDDATVTLRNAENQLTVVSRDDIDTLNALQTSLMPSDGLKDMNDQELRDLFAYLSLGTTK